MLTDRFVRNAKPGDHADVGGLYLRVSPKGKKVWVIRSQKNGKNHKRSIGTYPGMTLADARSISQGALVETTMEAALKAYKSKIQVRRPEQVDWLLRQLEEQSLTAGKQKFVGILQAKAETAPVMANRMLTRWQDFFNFCVQQGWLRENPLLGVQRKFIGGREAPNKKPLSWEAITGFMNLVLDPDTKLALYFILATGLRPSEALWVMRNRKLIDIPTKTIRHRVPAVPHIKAILRLVKHVPASHNTLSNALLRKGVGYTPHDLRRTFSTRLSDLGVLPHVVEKCLCHKMVGVMAVYNHADYWPERVTAMKLWGRQLSRLRKLAYQQRPALSAPV